ncbi:2-dehydro-3-deoxy-D-arabinonate dehydratase [Curtobacterium sp. PhB130]|nr:2-dehydro-3-deoxy-D-arabinonate dehydratase [Curtobacterium sp. PhB130]TCK58238.1 2-dehydro-3-deoxy-D-arabinonate dehydratase [Curtobacterium sp. PhB136]
MILRYRHHDHTQIGWADGNVVVPLADSLSDLLQLRIDDLRRMIDKRGDTSVPRTDVEVLAPIDGRTELWAAGVTYATSQSARIDESESSADVYAKVYDADRPELFFKSVGWRVIGDGGTIRARADSVVDVPEPELAVLVNAHRELVGFAVCNDMSSRTIEAANPLYLPQAKIYEGSSALGPGVVPVWEIADPYELELRLTIVRDGKTAWAGSAVVAQLHRRIHDLVDWLHRELRFPDGVWLSTGTCLVPELPFSVADGDEIIIDIPTVGTLTNLVQRVPPAPAPMAG